MAVRYNNGSCTVILDVDVAIMFVVYTFPPTQRSLVKLPPPYTINDPVLIPDAFNWLVMVTVPFVDKFPTPTGRAKFVPADVMPANERPDGEYPFVLITGRQLEHWHTGAMTRRASVLDAIEPEPTALIHPLDLDAMGAKPGEVISVASRRGIVSLYARADDGTPRGAVFIPFCYYEAAANLLTNPALDPFGKIPEFKYCAVKITKGGELAPVSSYGGGQALAAV